MERLMDGTENDDRSLNPALRHRQLCVVAHRLPLRHCEDEGWQRSPGGLVSALEPTLETTGGRWFGYTDDHAPVHPHRRGHAEYVALDLDHRIRSDAVDGCCNRTLWPALHGVSGNIEQSDDWWNCYFAHNNRTAAEVASRAQAGALVWVHDYHNFALAAELQRLRRDLRIGLFCHTPIDGSHLAGLSRGSDLLRRMSRFHLIGTQTERDADELRQQFERLGIEADVPIHSVPVGIDVDSWTARRADPEVERMSRRYSGGPGLVAVGIDRADYTKGLIAKLLAFEVALEQTAIEPDDLRLVQLATPTRCGIDAYDHVERETHNIADRINHAFTRSDGRQIVEILTEPRPPVEVAALMRAADIMLITPLRDGMNLVALESSVVNADRPTEVILSRTAGAAAYIGTECRLVTGADVLSIGNALRAVVDEGAGSNRIARSERRAHAVEQLDARAWVDTFTSLLGECDLQHPIFDSMARRSPGAARS